MRVRTLGTALLAAALAAPLAGCIVADGGGYHGGHGGPPPHAPAHGYRAQHRDHDLVFDGDLGVYVVVGLSNVWFLDGSYFRISGDHWEMSVGAGGPWRVATAHAVPGRLYQKRHPHGGPPGQTKKHGGNGRGNGKR